MIIEWIAKWIGGSLVALLFVGSISLAIQLAWPERNVRISDESWHVDSNGILVLGRFTLSNDGRWNLKDFVVGCGAEGSSGTTITTLRTTIYQRLNPPLS